MAPRISSSRRYSNEISMQPPSRKTASHKRRRFAPRVETLERRKLMSWTPDWNGELNVEAKDDYYTIRVDASDFPTRPTENDSSWRWPRYVPNDSPTTARIDVLQSQTSFAVSHEADAPWMVVEPQRIASVGNAQHGSVRLSEDRRTVFYKPEAGFEGVDQFEYVLEGVAADKAKAKIRINIVQPVLAVDDWFRVDSSSAKTIDVLKNDRANAAISNDARTFYYANGAPNLVQPNNYKIVSVGALSNGGSATISADGKSIEYRNPTGFEGLETFDYTVEDADGHQDVGSVSIRVGISEATKTLAEQESLRQSWMERILDERQWQFGAAESNNWHQWYISPVALSTTNRLSANDAVASRVEGTNRQVAGVDEGDTISTDGNYLYRLSKQSESSELITIDIRDPKQPKIVSRFRVTGDLVAQHLFADRLVLIINSLDNFDYNSSTTTVTTLDISDRSIPKVIHSSTLPGLFFESRMIADKFYVFSSGAQPIPKLNKLTDTETGAEFYETGRQFKERLGNSIYAASLEIVNRNSEGAVVSITKQSLPLEALIGSSINHVNRQVTISAFDVDSNEAGPIDVDATAAGLDTRVYVTQSGIHLFSQGWMRDWTNQKTTIDSFSIDATDGSVDHSARGEVLGTLLNQFSVGLNDGDLQVFHSDWHAGNMLSILRRDGTEWKKVGGLNDIAPGERIQSARFVGDRAYLVTFLQVDPLFVIDVSNATQPKILGELKIPGYSQYLHPLDATHILGIGRDADERIGQFSSLQVSLFDVSDLTQPKLQSSFQYAGGRSTFSKLTEWSFGLSDHKALGWFPEAGILATPLSHRPDRIWEGWLQDQNHAQVDLDLPEIEVLRIDLVKGIEKIGEVQSPSPVQRTLGIGDYLYVIADDRIIVTELLKPEIKVAELLFPKPAPVTDKPIKTPPLNIITILPISTRAPEPTLEELRKRFHNHTKPHDVNRDGDVAPLDALNIINFLRSRGPMKVADVVGRATTTESIDTALAESDFSLDVDNDGEIAPLDVLLVINQLRRTPGQADGEGQDIAVRTESISLTDHSSLLDTTEIDRQRRSRNLR